MKFKITEGTIMGFFIVFIIIAQLYTIMIVRDLEARIPITTTTIPETLGNCQVTGAEFYFHPRCGWCERQIEEGGLELLENSGVTIERIDVSDGTYDFIEVTPAWIIDNELSYGYKTIDDLKGMFACS